MQKLLTLFALWLLFVPDHLLAGPGELRFSSGEQRTALIELYTSEGCSSCPPADRWLSSLKNHPDLWTTFIPMSLHVDYWDYIGWKDPFAQARFSDRQRRLAAQAKNRFVYTPGVFRDGQEWRGWREGKMPGAKEKPVGVLTLSVSGSEVSVKFNPDNEMAQDLIAHVALLGMNLESRVLDGENHGKTLHHDFVVFDITTAAMTHTASGYTAMMSRPETSLPSNGLALVAWVAKKDQVSPIQSVGGILPVKN